MRLVNTLRTLWPCVCPGLLALAVMALAQTASGPEDAEGMSAFGKMIPLGFVNENVIIPSFKNAKPSSLLTAGTLTRVDEERLSAEKVVMEIYAEKAAETLKVELKSAIYHMPDRILRSGERSKVSRTDFEMEGDSLIFDATTSIGSMKGRVRTLIFDMKPVSGKPEGNPPNQ